MRAPTTTFWLSTVVAVVVASFLAASGVLYWQTRSIDRTARDIEETAAPAIEHLAAARAETRHLRVLLHGAPSSSELIVPSADELRAIDETHAALDEALEQFLGLPAVGADLPVRAHVLRTKQEVDAALIRLGALHRPVDIRAATTAVGRLDEATSRAVEANARHAESASRHIRLVRDRSITFALVLDAVCIAIAGAGVFFVRRTQRVHAELDARHRQLLEARADELEQFAGRIAHDILSPLQAVGMALELAGGERRIHQRGRAALDRVKTLVGGLLEFARAGGRPTPGAATSVGATVMDLVRELEPTANETGARVEIAGELAGIAVACHRGVLTSLVANLVRNAIKHADTAPEPRIVVRVQSSAEAVRIEVIDNGPGLAPDVEHHVFEPYVRARSAKAPGIGLGLATVKRLAESHGGTVGVRSVPGQGCTFWFTLPRVDDAAARDEREGSDDVARVPTRAPLRAVR